VSRPPPTDVVGAVADAIRLLWEEGCPVANQPQMAEADVRRWRSASRARAAGRCIAAGEPRSENGGGSWLNALSTDRDG